MATAAPLRKYLSDLREYASTTSVPGLEQTSRPIPLDEVFVELELRPAPALITHSRRGITNQYENESPDPFKLVRPESALSALGTHQRLVILGEPGQGKSTLLRQYASELAQDPNPRRLPLLVELGRMRERVSSESEYDWLFERVPDRVHFDAALRKHFREAITEGKVSLLLDAYDEIGRNARSQVHELIPSIEANQIVLTSRPDTYYLAPLGGFSEFRLQDLEPRQIKLLAENVMQALDPGATSSDHLRAVNKVLEVAVGPAATMARNPLLLSFMCLTAIQRAKDGALRGFPIRPVSLIRECIAILVEWHRVHKVPRSWPLDLQAASVTRMLAPLALASFQNASGRITQNELSDETLLSPNQRTVFLRHLVPARFIEKHEEDYVFTLETFREYFAAREIALSPNPYSIVERRLHQPNWQQLIVYVAGSLPRGTASRVDLLFPMTSSLVVRYLSVLLKVGAAILGKSLNEAGPGAGEIEGAKTAIDELTPMVQGSLASWLARSRRSTEFFLRSIMQHRCRYEDRLHRNLRLAARCLAASTSAPEKLKRKIVARVLKASAHGYIERELLGPVRDMAGDPSVCDYLMEVTQMEKRAPEAWGGKRPPAAWALQGAAAAGSVRKRLLELIENDSDIVAKAAAEGLKAAVSSPETWPSIVKLLGHPESAVQKAASEALRLVAGEPLVRSDLLRLISDPGPPSQTILERLEHNEMRKYALEAFRGRALEHDITERLLALMQEEDGLLRGSAAEIVQEAAFRAEVLQHLLELTSSAHAYYVRESAIVSLRRVAFEPKVRDRLLELTYEADLTGAACSALKLVAAEPSVWRRLLELTYPGSAARVSAIQALQTAILQHEVRVRCFELLREDSYEISDAAARILRSVALQPEIWRTALELSKDEWVRGRAVFILQSATIEPEVWSRLSELIKDSDPTVAEIALSQINGVGGPVSARLLRHVRRAVGRGIAYASTLEQMLAVYEDYRAQSYRESTL